ncbi:MAG: YcxB family protein [Pseudomonadota bacterium]
MTNGTKITDIELGFTPDYREMFAVQGEAARYQYSWKLRWGWLPLMVVAITSIVAVMQFDATWIELAHPLVGAPYDEYAGFILVVGLGAFWGWFSFGFLLPRWSASALTAKAPPQFTTVRFDDDGGTFESDATTIGFRWSAVDQIVKTHTGICFMLGGLTLYVPHRAFETDAEKTQLVTAALPLLRDDARARSLGAPDLKAIASAA